MEKPNKLVASAPNSEMLMLFILQFIPVGYKVEKLTKHRRFFWNKPYRYTIVLSLMRDIPQEIKEAVEEEKYEIADKLKKQLNVSEEEFYHQRTEAIKKELESLHHIFK